MWSRNRNSARDSLVCDAAMDDELLAREQALTGRTDTASRQELERVRRRIKGMHAKCMVEQRLERKGMTYEARATRQAHKTEIVRQRQEAAQAKLATKMQRLEYRQQKAQMRAEGGGGMGSGKTVAAVGGIGLVAAAVALFAF